VLIGIVETEAGQRLLCHPKRVCSLGLAIAALGGRVGREAARPRWLPGALGQEPTHDLGVPHHLGGHVRVNRLGRSAL